MNFLWPQYLGLMLAVPLLPLLYLWLLQRRRKRALRYSDLRLVREASSSAPWRRHVPPALLWIACASLLLAASRPLVSVTLPWARTSILLAMDVSLSMRVSDVKPTRLAAAQEAAKLFLRDLPKGIEVGLVTLPAPPRSRRRRRWIAARWSAPSTRSRCSTAPPSATPSSSAWRSCSRSTASISAT